jgi:hypothetical protein
MAGHSDRQLGCLLLRRGLPVFLSLSLRLHYHRLPGIWPVTCMSALYGDRILAFDTPAARIAGTLSDRARGLGYAPGFADIIIAATAHHGLTILSRNIRHFKPLGVVVLDPFAALTPV